MIMIKPLGTLVTIKIHKVDQKQTASGLFIPKDKWGEKENTGEILALPTDCPVKELKTGQNVLFNPYAILESNQEGVHLIKAEDILGILE